MDAQILVINGVTVDVAAEELSDPAGRTIELRPQTFAVLRHLLQHANRLVTKDELMQAVWPGVAVTDDSLVQCVHEIRRALRDDAHATLKTVPRRGYRLVLPAGPGVAAAAPRSAPRSAVAAAALAVLAVGLTALAWWSARLPNPGADAAPSIAVLPFDNLGDDPAQNYFADGITEDLITDLSKVPGIFVIARNSVWEYRDEQPNLRQIADELGVRYLVEGSVRRDGDQIRVNAQLIDARSGHHVWAERYDGAVSDVFAVQDKVIANVVSAMAVKLSEGAQPDGAAETASVAAYDALQQGRDYLRRESEGDTLKAIDLFETAIALDPNYTNAYTWLAAAQWRIVLSYWFVSSGAGWQHAYEGLITSLAKAKQRPTALAYAISAQLLALQGRYDEGLAEVERAMALSPSNPDNYLAHAAILNAIGKAPEAEEQVRLVMRLDPRFAPPVLRTLAISLFNQGKFQEAAATFERLIARQSDLPVDYASLISALGHLGRLDDVPRLTDAYNGLAVPAGYDPLTVRESAYDWYGVAFSYHRPYIDQMLAGLRKAGIWEGAGVDLALDDYAGLMTRTQGEFDVKGATKVSVAEAKALQERGVPLIDVRAHSDYANGHLPGAVNLSLIVDLSRETLATVAGPNDEVVLYCHGKYCPVSAYASAKAVKWGWTHVFYFAGGFPAWQDAGYPVEVSEPSQP